MAVSRRLRYEILRRDNHACRYCGATAPDVKLTVDHVLPVALGGRDDADNLVTACQPCNAGKSSSSPDAPIVDAVSADALRWSAAMRRAGVIQAAQNESRRSYCDWFDKAWVKWTYADGTQVTRPSNWRSTIGRHHDAGLELAAIVDLVDDVLPRSIPDDRMWAYFCGALRNVMQDRADIAAQLLAQEDFDGD